jgi:hypothetical protein
MFFEALLGLAALTVLVTGGWLAVLARQRRARPATFACRPSVLGPLPLWSVAALARRPLAPPSDRPRCWEGAVPSKSRAEDVLDWLEANGWQRFEVSFQPDGVFLVRSERREREGAPSGLFRGNRPS